MSFDIGLSKPDMRAATENELRLIAQGLKSRGQVGWDCLFSFIPDIITNMIYTHTHLLICFTLYQTLPEIKLLNVLICINIYFCLKIKQQNSGKQKIIIILTSLQGTFSQYYPLHETSLKLQPYCKTISIHDGGGSGINCKTQGGVGWVSTGSSNQLVPDTNWSGVQEKFQKSVSTRY